MGFNLKSKTQDWDATYVFPRPANEQYLSSYKAFWRLFKDASAVAASLVFAVGSSMLAVYTCSFALNTFNLSFLGGLGFIVLVLTLAGLFGIWSVFGIDLSGALLPYRLEFQRESHGGRTWATMKDLSSDEVDAIRLNDANIEGTGVFLAPFRKAHQIFLTLNRMAQAIIIYGPPGSGKSSTFFMPVIRQFAACGGSIVLDVKGELFAHCAHWYSNVFRLDLQNPLNSDWFDLFGGCYRNPDKARRIASYMVGFDPNKNSAKEPIWDQSAVSMLTVMILYLCEMKEHPTPRDILNFLAETPKTASRFNEKRNQPENYSPLNDAFDKCPYALARQIWNNNFAGMPKDTFGSVKFNADTAISQLLSPKVTEILRPPTASERKKGRRRIDFSHLRQMFDYGKNGKKRGSAVFVVVSPSDAMDMDVFLRVVFSVALDTLRRDADGKNVLVALDEAGNVPLSKLPEGINTDRSKGICYFLGYQDSNQPINQYGREGARAFTSTAGVNIFMPGVDDDTADLASKRLGETTILQRSSSDAKNDGFDSEKMSEAGRKLMLPQELTQMKWFTQSIITLKGTAPIRARIPADAKMTDTRISTPQRIVDVVSDEVLRMIGMKTGREDDIEVQGNNGQFIPPSLRREIPDEKESQKTASENAPAADNSVSAKVETIEEKQPVAVKSVEEKSVEIVEDEIQDVVDDIDYQDVDIFADEKDDRFDELEDTPEDGDEIETPQDEDDDSVFVNPNDDDAPPEHSQKSIPPAIVETKSTDEVFSGKRRNL